MKKIITVNIQWEYLAESLVQEEEIFIDNPEIPKIIDIIKIDKIYAYILEYKKGKTIEDTNLERYINDESMF